MGLMSCAYDSDRAPTALGPNGNPGSPTSVAGFPLTHAPTAAAFTSKMPHRTKRVGRIIELTAVWRLRDRKRCARTMRYRTLNYAAKCSPAIVVVLKCDHPVRARSQSRLEFVKQLIRMLRRQSRCM